MLEILGPSNSRSLGRKWCSNALPYRRICLSNAPPKEQSASPAVPVVCNKACVYSRYAETLIPDGKLFKTLATRYTVSFESEV